MVILNIDRAQQSPGVSERPADGCGGSQVEQYETRCLYVRLSFAHSYPHMS